MTGPSSLHPTNDGFATLPQVLALLRIEENVYTADHTLDMTDFRHMVTMNMAASSDLTIPLNSAVPIPVGAVIPIYAAGAGGITVGHTGGVTVRGETNLTQYQVYNLWKRGIDEWVQYQISSGGGGPISYVVSIVVSDPNGSALTAGDGKAYFRVPLVLNGLNLTGVGGHVTTPSSSGIPTFQIANVTDSVDMLSTKLTIDATEKDSITATTAAVIDTAHDDVSTGDELRIDCDVSGTGAKGAIVDLTFSA